MDDFFDVSPSEMAVADALGDRRSASRHRILQRCVVRPAGSTVNMAWKSIAFDISATGIGIALQYPISVGTFLVVEPSGPRAGTPLQARVLRERRVAHLWFYGCELSVPLKKSELDDWLASDAAVGPGALLM